MGARAQVKIEDTGVYLYTHWGSGEIEDDVINAITSDEGRGRWRDAEYLTRIIFDFMKYEGCDMETGFGIGTEAHYDLDFDPIVVNCSKKVVYWPNGGETKFDDL